MCTGGQTRKLYYCLARRAYTSLIKEQIEVVYDVEPPREQQSQNLETPRIAYSTCFQYVQCVQRLTEGNDAPALTYLLPWAILEF